MANLLDYLEWRGDLDFRDAPFNEVDSLVLSTLSYVPLDGVLPQEGGEALPLGRVAAEMQALPQDGLRFHNSRDARLLELAGASRRFSNLLLSNYVNRIDTKQQKQFAALSFRLPGGEAYIAFRGTDDTLVGWKEDFNMSFMPVVPAQRDAAAYVAQASAAFPGPLRLGGHSKGGNLAVYAAAYCEAAVQGRILAVYNHDGPGFSPETMAYPGYRAVIGRVRSFVPQSSVVGMLLEHEEKYTVVYSRETGLMQHDPYSWEVLGPGFVTLEEVTQASRRTDRAIKAWLSEMSVEEREAFVDGLYQILCSREAKSEGRMSPTALREGAWETRRAVRRAFAALFKAAKAAHRETEGE